MILGMDEMKELDEICQTKREEEVDLKRMIKLRVDLQRRLPGCIVDIDFAFTQSTSWIIPFSFERDSITTVEWAAVDKTAASLSCNHDGVEGPRYFLHLNRTYFYWRSWSWPRLLLLWTLMILFTVSASYLFYRVGNMYLSS